MALCLRTVARSTWINSRLRTLVGNEDTLPSAIDVMSDLRVADSRLSNSCHSERQKGEAKYCGVRTVSRHRLRNNSSCDVDFTVEPLACSLGALNMEQDRPICCDKR